MNNESNQIITQLSNTIDLDILDSGLTQVNAEWNMESVQSPFSRLYYTLEGIGSIFFQNEEIRLLPNRLYLIPNNMLYSCHCDFMIQIWFHVMLTVQDGLDVFYNCNQICSIEVSTGHLTRIAHLYRAYDLMSAMELKTLLCRDIFLLSKQVMLPLLKQPPSPIVSEVYSVAQNPISAQNSCRSIARFLNVSESTLSKIFKKETGMTIGHYLNQLVIKKACQLVLTTSKPISEISGLLSFRDPYYFSKFFHNNVGVPPSIFRKRVHAASKP